MTDNPNVMMAMEGLELPSNPPTVVGPKCDADEGRWLCVNDALFMVSNLQMESHVADGKRHLLVWHCLIHGPETP